MPPDQDRTRAVSTEFDRYGAPKPRRGPRNDDPSAGKIEK
jgi:hypothetical protein